MSDELQVFESRYGRACHRTLWALLGTIFFSLAAVSGIWDVELDETLTDIEIAQRLEQRWTSRGHGLTEAVCDEGSAEDVLLCEFVRERGGIRNRAQLDRILENLEGQADQHHKRSPVSLFGTDFPWKHAVTIRWVPLILAMLFLGHFLIREKELMQIGLAIARTDEEVTSLYRLCSLSQPLVVPPSLLDSTPRGHWRSWLIATFLGIPGLVFFGSMAFVYSQGTSELPAVAHRWNIVFSALFVGLTTALFLAYRANHEEWVAWWELAREERQGKPYIGSFNFAVTISEPEMQQFSHQGTAKISRQNGALRLRGTSYLHDDEADRVQACPWEEPHAILVGDHLLLLKFQFQHLGQQVRALMEINDLDLADGETMKGTYFQLLPDVFVVSGKVELGR